jgi:signal transduction histidine kinase
MHRRKGSAIERMKRPSRTESPRTFQRRLPNAFPGGFAYINSNLVFTLCNDVQAACFGSTPEEVIGRRPQDVAPGNPEFCRDLERVVETGEGYSPAAPSAPWSVDPATEEPRYIVNYLADLDSHGDVKGVFITALDVTPSMHAERESARALRERNDELEKRVEEREFFVGIVSHELRAPLATIYGNAHLLHRLEDLDEESRSHVINDIRTEAERLNRLVENMLLLARSGAQAPVPTEPILLQKAIEEVVSEQRKRSTVRPITLSVKPSHLMAEAQPDYLKQVLQNLLSNAEKYSPSEQPIDIRARPTGSGVKISIFDRGPGIDPSESQIVFQPFYRSARTATEVSGAGIGLAVCKLLVQAQSGHILTHPRRGGGTVFAFTLPGAA